MIILYETIEKPGSVELRVMRVFGRGGEAQLPERIGGRPVTELGAYAFSDRIDRQELEGMMARGKLCRIDGAPAESTEGLPELAGEKLTEVSLPGTLKKIGRYAFYNCGNLRTIKFGGALADLGAGAFTGCHRIGRLQAQVQQDGSSCLKELLAELPEELRVDLCRDKETGRFWFPEFFEEGVENTPARILENHVHGSGIRYRNCFLHKTLNIREYDHLFPYAKAWEGERAVTALAMDRILYPMELSGTAREQYLDYLNGHFGTAVSLLSEQREYGLLSKLTEDLLPARDAVHAAIEEAQSREDTECVSLLMDYLHRHTKKQRKVFEL